MKRITETTKSYAMIFALVLVCLVMLFSFSSYEYQEAYITNFKKYWLYVSVPTIFFLWALVRIKKYISKTNFDENPD
jgi:regulator of protease activity HflC (stomatin/prohibitin superfamily)